MTDSVGPRPDILDERLKNLSGKVDDIQRHTRGLATKEDIQTMIGMQNQLFATQLTAIIDDVKDIAADLATERAERIAAQEKADVENKAAHKDADDRISRSRMYALSAIGLGVTILLALITLVSQIGGAPA